MSEVIALTWFSHRRMTGLCESLGIELRVVSSGATGLRRYFELVPRTVRLLSSRRPRLLFVQNPSLALTALVTLLRVVFRYRLVVDAHNEAVEPFINRSYWLKWIAGRLLRHADLTLVTNRWLARIVERHGGRAFVLPDRLPEVTESGPQMSHGALERSAPVSRVVVIATYAPDEPVAAIFEAARLLAGEVEFHCTGNPAKLAEHLRERAPPNVRFTGFLEEEQYWALLRGADMVMDLTLMDSCLVCGAYEAIAVGKPAILSRNEACLELFGGAALFTDNSAADIAASVRKLARVRAEVARAIPGIAARLRASWQVQAGELSARLRELVAAH